MRFRYLLNGAAALAFWLALMAITPSARAAEALYAHSESAPAPQTAIGVWSTVVIVEPILNSATPSALTTGALANPVHSGPRLTGKTHALTGVASYYWQDQMTATGERFNKRDMTAAHKTLPFGTRVRVTRVDTGANVIVRINDRGPFKHGRVIDLSEKAAENLRMTSVGTTPVRLEVLGQ